MINYSQSTEAGARRVNDRPHGTKEVPNVRHQFTDTPSPQTTDPLTLDDALWRGLDGDTDLHAEPLAGTEYILVNARGTALNVSGVAALHAWLDDWLQAHASEEMQR